MVRYPLHAAVLATAAFLLPPAGATAGDDPVLSYGLYRVRVLVEGDARGIWLGDSWGRMGRIDRLPYGALATWPFTSVSAVSMAHVVGVGIGRLDDYTGGPGSLQQVDYHTGWVVETNDGEPARFALPVDDMTRVFGDAALVLPTSGGQLDRIQGVGIRNSAFAATDSGPFSVPGQQVRCRMMYYAPADLSDLVERVVLTDDGVTVRGVAHLRDEARPRWRLGQNPDTDPPAPAGPTPHNPAPVAIELAAPLEVGPRLVMRQDPASPLVGSEDYWFFAGASFYRVDASGVREPGYYHTALTEDSWSFAGHAEDRQSQGDKVYTDEQLGHWLDVTTLDRAQQPVVVLHIATESRTVEELTGWVQRIRERYRTLFAQIGAPEPRFLLIGSYMHQIPGRDLLSSRAAVERLDEAFGALAAAEQDCAFFSLYQATDGVFFTTDNIGGPGTQQAARDWLDANGWSTITYGGVTYNLSSADDGGDDGVFTTDGLHLTSGPGAALLAKLIGDAIAASSCPGDFDDSGAVNTLDVLAFLNAWAAGDPSADINGDGAVNTLDVLAFLNAWAAGC